MSIHDKVEEEFTGKGSILRNLSHYENRRGQLEMAIAVADALSEGANLMVEAGTGIGKSFAYLIPLIHWSKKEDRRAVVATGTKVLQNQLVSNDLPFLAQHSEKDFTFEVLFGQENFFCRRRAGAVTQYGLFDDDAQAAELKDIADWARQESGIFEDYPEPISPRLRQQISRRSEACPRRNCAYYTECPYYRKRRAAEQADILIINHHLFFAHLESAGTFLPEFGAVVFDEAHRLEQVAASYSGVRLNSIGLSLLCSRIYNPRRGLGLVPKLPDFSKIKTNVGNLITRARGAAENFFANVANLMGPSEYKKRVRDPECVPNDLEQPLGELAGFLFEKARDVDEEGLAFELTTLADRVAVAKDAVVNFLVMDNPSGVYWVEAAANSDRVSIHSALTDVSALMADSIWSQDWVNILTSATLTVGKSFSFTSGRIGFKDSTLKLGSPFNYRENALTYVGHDLVWPKHPEWTERIAERVGALLKASEGRALVLFTSYATLNKAVGMLEDELCKNHTVLVQGRTTRNLLLDEFRFDTSSVLFATQSFWEGVDVPGESLVMLVITRLPFEVPDDPRAEAILEGYRSKGRDPFTEYQLPLSVLRFRQGIGRLIRRDDDYGVIAVLDSRIVKKAYGRLFLDSMPPAPVVFNLFEIQRFFQDH